MYAGLYCGCNVGHIYTKLFPLLILPQLLNGDGLLQDNHSSKIEHTLLAAIKGLRRYEHRHAKEVSVTGHGSDAIAETDNKDDDRNHNSCRRRPHHHHGSYACLATCYIDNKARSLSRPRTDGTA